MSMRFILARCVYGIILSLLTCNMALAATNPPKKVVLITGGAGGIGREISLAFKNEGWNVWATSRNPSNHPAIDGINIRQLDVTDSQSIAKLISEIQQKNGKIDVLINNAGYAVLGPIETVSLKQARELLDVNVIGPLQLMQACLPIMRNNHGGHIINVSSTSGLRALPGLGIYAASKMALEGLSEAIAAEAAQWNIWVSIVEPGTVNNNWVNNSPLAENLASYPGYKGFTNKLQTTLSKKALEAGQKPDEIAQLCLKIANTSKPDLRYQTNSTSASLAHEVLNDPTGNQMREKTVAFAKEMYGANF